MELKGGHFIFHASSLDMHISFGWGFETSAFSRPYLFTKLRTILFDAEEGRTGPLCQGPTTRLLEEVSLEEVSGQPLVPLGPLQ